jgi:phosphoenolpyruvate-protein kinase (PTS system EI component)
VKTGVTRVPGIAVGRAVLWGADPVARRNAGTWAEERARLARGIATAKRGIFDLMRLLPRTEAELFEPELLILDELSTTLRERLVSGMRAEDVVEDSAGEVGLELLIDARARILDAMAHSYRSVDEHLDGCDGDVVLVVEALTPSVVASLPARVVGIVAALNGGEGGASSTSHSEILAREREITLALLVPPELSSIEEGEIVVVNTMEEAAVVSVAPSEGFVQDALAKRHAWLDARAAADAEAAEPLRDLGVAVMVNLGSLRDRIPASAEGIGLVRTELVFSGRAVAPSEPEQFGVACAIASLYPRSPTTVRLFDGGDDKPLPWLPCPPGAESARGVELLLHHPEVLAAQIRALERAADHASLRVLVPYVRNRSDVLRVRAKARGRLAIGAQIETVEAVDRIDEIASVSDFISIGTNDLSAGVTGIGRANAGLSLDSRLLALIERVVAACSARSLSVSVCGEMAGDLHGARVLIGLGVGAISVAPARVVPVKRALRGASIDDCRAIARAAMTPS